MTLAISDPPAINDETFDAASARAEGLIEHAPGT